MIFYSEALATIKASRLPIPLTILHLRNGILAGQTCDGCRHLRDFCHAGPNNTTTHDLLCALGGGPTYWSRDWPACGRWDSDGKVLSRPATKRRQLSLVDGDR